MNRLDQVAKMLKEQLREYEKDERDLARAKARVQKALAQFETDKSPSVGRPVTYRMAGPRRGDSGDVLLSALEQHVHEGMIFTRKQAEKWCSSEYRPTDPLRRGQVHGAVRLLMGMGYVTPAAGRGAYLFNGKHNGKGDE